MAKKSAPKHVEPEDESQDLPEEQAELEATEPDDEPDSGETISKSEAARRALAAGLEGPEEATDFIRKQFGIEMSKPHFSAVKSQLKKKEGSGAKPKAKRGRKPKEEAPSKGVEGYLAPPPKQPAASGQPDLLAAMEAMKPLVESLGAEKVKRIVDLLG